MPGLLLQQENIEEQTTVQKKPLKASDPVSFTIPDYHSEVLRRGAKPVVAALAAARTEAALTHDGPKSAIMQLDSPRDHHAPPTFESGEAFAAPTVPTLYLPPLLSSLPVEHNPHPLPEENPPIITATHLPDIDPASLSLHRALHNFRPVNDQYSSAAYGDAFNWSHLELPEDEVRDWYVVAFRSKRKDGSDGTPLYDADKNAHEEAVRNGGLIMYWYGVPHPVTGLNLATCIWQSRKHAIAANSRPHHIKAMRLAAVSYERYDFERYVLRKEVGKKNLSIEPFTGGDVGW